VGLSPTYNLDVCVSSPQIGVASPIPINHCYVESDDQSGEIWETFVQWWVFMSDELGGMQDAAIVAGKIKKN